MSGQIQSIMNNRKCTYTFTIEKEGNKVKTENIPGTVRSEVHQKVTEKGTYSMIWVEDDATGEMREVFVNGLKFPK